MTEENLPPGAREVAAPKKSEKAVTLVFTEGQVMRLDRHLDKLTETLPEGYVISRHAFMKETILRAIQERD